MLCNQPIRMDRLPRAKKKRVSIFFSVEIQFAFFFEWKNKKKKASEGGIALPLNWQEMCVFRLFDVCSIELQIGENRQTANDTFGRQLRKCT